MSSECHHKKKIPGSKVQVKWIFWIIKLHTSIYKIFFCRSSTPDHRSRLEWESCAVWPRTGWRLDKWYNLIMVGAGQRLSAEEKLRLEIFISSVYISLTFPTFLHHQAPAHPCTGEHKGPVCVATVMAIRACQRGDKSNKQCEGEHCDALFHSLVHLCLQSKPVCPDVVRQTLFVYSKSVFSDHH